MSSRVGWLSVCMLLVNVYAVPAGATIGTISTVDLDAKPRSIAYDAARNVLYVSNQTMNKVDIVDVASATVTGSIAVGSQPEGLAIDVSSDVLWVVNHGANNLSRIDLGTYTEVLPRITTPDVAYNVMIATDSTGVVRTGSYFSGYTAYMFDGITGDIGAPLALTANQAWREFTSANGSVLVQTTRSQARLYHTMNQQWTDLIDLPSFSYNWWDWLNSGAISDNAEWLVVSNTNGTKILDDSGTLFGTVSVAYYGLAVDPIARQAYGVNRTSQLDTINLESSLVTESITLPRNIAANDSYPETRYWTSMILNEEGTLLFVLHTNGVSIIETGLPPRPKVLELHAPVGSEQLVSGSEFQIDWSSSGAIPTVQLHFSDDEGDSWTLIDEVDNTGSYAWTVPAVTSNDCMIRVSTPEGDVVEQNHIPFIVYVCQREMTADLDGDCYVNWTDFTLFTLQWQTCGNPYDPGCQL